VAINNALPLAAEALHDWLGQSGRFKVTQRHNFGTDQKPVTFC